MAFISSCIRVLKSSMNSITANINNTMIVNNSINTIRRLSTLPNTHIIQDLLKKKVIKNKNGLVNNSEKEEVEVEESETKKELKNKKEENGSNKDGTKKESKKVQQLKSATLDNKAANEQYDKASLVLIDKNRTSGLKHCKPTTPSMRFTVFTDRKMLHKGPPIKKLTSRICRSGGRNHHGKITVRHRGGGGVRKYRMVDFKRIILDTPGKVLRLEYDPFRRAHLALISYPHDTVIPNERKLNLAKTSEGLLQYIIAPQNLAPGDTISSSRTQLVPIYPGNAMILNNIPIGVWIYNIELIPGYGAKVCRSAGTTAQILEKIPGSNHALVRFRSKEQRLISLDCLACIGAVSNPDAASANLGKAGRSRWLGRRPQTRGTAMNPIDHPHGGGHGKDHGGRYTSLTPWGKPTKGYRTRDKHKSNKLISKRRFDK